MRNMLVALSLCLLACDSPGTSDPAPFVSCGTASAALCSRFVPGECGWLSVPITPDDSWNGEDECRDQLVGDHGYEIGGRCYGCACDDGTSYAPCLAAVEAMSCEANIHNDTIHATLMACSRPVITP